ncbi:IS3 family transposase [Streptomyces sp. AK04-3B]|uniref:IS3 family transposase n=1 Tax=Streptomyces sp. AK04-3B TaxID=3028650 RepID=UPI0039F4A76E
MLLRTASAFSAAQLDPARPRRPRSSTNTRTRGSSPSCGNCASPPPPTDRWRRTQKEPCERVGQNPELTGRIRQIHQDSHGIYGAPGSHAALNAREFASGSKRIEGLMRQAGLTGISTHRNKDCSRLRTPNKMIFEVVGSLRDG